MIRLYHVNETDEQAIDPHPWDLPPEAKQDEGWLASQWQPYSDDWVYGLGPQTFDEIIAEELKQCP